MCINTCPDVAFVGATEQHRRKAPTSNPKRTYPNIQHGPGYSPPRGVFVPAPTFFTGQNIDLDTQSRHAIYLADNGIKGIVLLGSTGEGVHIHPKERKTILATVRKALDRAGHQDFLVICGTATQNVDETVDQLVDARDAGAAYGQCLAPAYNAAGRQVPPAHHHL